MNRLKIGFFLALIFFLSVSTGKQTGYAQGGDFSIGDTVAVATTGQNLNLRAEPGTDYAIVARLPNGTLMTVVGGPASANGYTWWELDGSLGRGWAAGEFLRPAEGLQAAGAEAGVPRFIWPLAAPWPAGVTLHAADDGSGYGEGFHLGTDRYAMDFNGWPKPSETPIETNDRDLLVLSAADGCVKKVEYSPGYYDANGVWKGNYGWNVVISHFGGYEIRYAHLKEMPLVEGPRQSLLRGCDEWVSQGQPLGQIAGTGTPNDGAVHLHFAIYYCNPSQKNCAVQSVVPEPLDGISPLGDHTKVSSQNYSVGYEAIQGEALTTPARLKFHQPIYDEYKRLGGQEHLFGRAAIPVLPFGSGSHMYYQAFVPHALMSTFPTTILEHNGRGFMVPQPMMDEYVRGYPTYGTPQSRTYVTLQSAGETGWRADFSQASLFWHFGLARPLVWSPANAPWMASFCPGTQNFTCSPAKRFDPYINFTFSDSNNPGPLSGVQGFSAAWQAILDGDLVSQISLGYEVQGHVRFYIDDKPQGDWIHAENGISGVTRPTWHVGDNTFRIEFWQAPGKPARLRLEVQEEGLFPEVHAFEPQDPLASAAYVPPAPADYADFEPPPYPGEESAPPGGLPGIGDWWEELVSGLEQGITDWWQGLTEQVRQAFVDWLQRALERLAEDMEQAVVQALSDLLRSLEQSCSGAYVLVGGIFISAAWMKRRRR